MLAHTPYDAVQTVDLLVGVASRRLLWHQRSREQSFGGYRHVGDQASDWVAADCSDACCAWTEKREEQEAFQWSLFDVTCEEYYLEPHQRQASLIIVPFLSSNPLLCNGAFNLPVLLVFLGSGL